MKGTSTREEPPCLIARSGSERSGRVICSRAQAESGDVLVSGQDVGKAPRDFWGDSDYEFMAYVSAEHKDGVLRALLNKLDSEDGRAAYEARASAGHSDEAILALLETLYSGNRHAVDEFLADMRSQGVVVEFGSWV